MELTLIISAGILLGCVLGLSWFAGTDAPYVPTNIATIRKILRISGVGKNKKFYELGSGDGRVVIEAAKMGANSTGLEQSWIRVLYSIYRAWKLKLKKAKFYHGNIFSKKYNDADIVYIYLLLKGVNKLENKLKQELKKGSIVITQTYHFSNWKPFKKINLSKEIDLSRDINGAGDFWIYLKS